MKDENNYVMKYLLRPLLSGLVGFSSILLIISIIKILDVYLNRATSFSIRKEDLIYCFISFFVVGGLELFKNFKHRQIL